MSKHIFIISLAITLLSCNSTNTDDKTNTANISQHIQRFGMVTGIKPDKIADYKKLHAAAWSDVLKKIKECHIQNYSIYLQKIEDKYYLFSYFEYAGNNFDEDMKKMAADTTTQRWWKETDPTQLPLPEAAAQHKIWTSAEEVFHTP